MRALFVALALWLAAAPASAQVGSDWLRRALTPTAPNQRKAPSNAIFPPQVISLRFSHRQHVEADVKCMTCHDAVDSSARAADVNIPAHPQCESCHDIDAAREGEETDPLSTCAACHVGHVAGSEQVAPDAWPANNIVFSHDLHLKKGAACSECHSGVETADLGTRAHLPKMVTCLKCHDGQAAANTCSTCHLTEPDGLLRTKFATGTLAPSGVLRDDDHGRDFLKRHAQVARRDTESCSTCHRDAECESCHAASSKAFRLHPPDFTQSHGIVAKGREMDCASCHREQSFCVSCHQVLGVAAESIVRRPNFPAAAQAFHSPGFKSRDRANPEHHAWSAQANIQACASCHQEETCLQCHASPTANAGAYSFNPHPVGWSEGDAECRAFKASPVACAKCHGQGEGPTSLASLFIRCP